MHLHLLPIAPLIKRLLGWRLVVWLHGIEVWDGPRRRRIHGMDAVDLFVAISEETLARTESWRPPGVRCLVLSPTADFEKFCPGPVREDLRERYGLPAREDVILTVGRLASGEGYKGHDLVIRGLPEVLNRRPKTKYLIVGTGDDRARLERLAGDLAVADHVVFAGKVSAAELVEHYRLASVFVMPSAGEGFGIVYLEALGCGCRVVAANTGGAVDALAWGRFGALVPPGDVAALASEVLHALESGGDLSLRPEVVRRFGQERFAREVREMIEFVVKPCAA